MTVKKTLKNYRYLIDILPTIIEKMQIFHYSAHCIIYIKPWSSKLTELFFFQKHLYLKLNYLIDIFAIDNLTLNKFVDLKRFSIVYNFLSLRYRNRTFFKINLNEKEKIMSIASVYEGAKWLEREIWDLFGIFFVKNEDLRRILTDYGFKGHPLRKDFPLTGFLEVRYDDSKKCIVYDKVELAQEYRLFDFKSPWIK